MLNWKCKHGKHFSGRAVNAEQYEEISSSCLSGHRLSSHHKAALEEYFEVSHPSSCDVLICRFHDSQMLHFELSSKKPTMILLTPSSGFFQRTSKLFLSERASWVQLKEFARKNAANTLSVANMVMGMASILSSLNGHHYAACWLVLIGYLLDLADGAVARRLNACSALGAKLDDFADFTTFGIATSLLLRTPNILDNILCMCYVLSVFIRLCFFSSGIPFMYRGLPCIYSSAILACLSLLTGGNMAVLRFTAVVMILFMVSQTLYPHDRVLESQAWKKVIYAGGIIMVFCSSFPLVCLYYLLCLTVQA
ncbi:transmembrane protein 269 isoform 2-T2 [Clarias gariepinus]|uniref:transmembrane protein 269 isoform X2 n=1 Tax=Clarias gariepinus TaxID=13013 RepID=UPI00234E2F2E|nr:transmembrane protein 269 isoform X2 [Clarias gariepinus]